MEKFSIQCRCSRELRVPETLLGRAVACSDCGAVHRLICTGPPIPLIPSSPRQRAPFVGRLTIIRGPVRVQENLFLGGDQPLLIGKIPGKNIILPGERVSRHHARLVLTGNTWWIEDLNSTNGIRVNNQRVASKALIHGDEIHIGDFDLLYLETFEGVNWKPKANLPTLEPVEEEERVARSGGIDELLGHSEKSDRSRRDDLLSTIAGESNVPNAAGRTPAPQQQSPFTAEGSTTTDGLVPMEEILPLEIIDAEPAKPAQEKELVIPDEIEQQLREASGLDKPGKPKSPKSS